MSARRGTKYTAIKQIPIPLSTAALTCEHEATYKCAPPVVNDYVYCRECKEYRVVTQVTRKGVVNVAR